MHGQSPASPEGGLDGSRDGTARREAASGPTPLFTGGGACGLTGRPSQEAFLQEELEGKAQGKKWKLRYLLPVTCYGLLSRRSCSKEATDLT